MICQCREEWRLLQTNIQPRLKAASIGYMEPLVVRNPEPKAVDKSGLVVRSLGLFYQSANGDSSHHGGNDERRVCEAGRGEERSTAIS